MKNKTWDDLMNEGIRFKGRRFKDDVERVLTNVENFLIVNGVGEFTSFHRRNKHSDGSHDNPIYPRGEKDNVRKKIDISELNVIDMDKLMDIDGYDKNIKSSWRFNNVTTNKRMSYRDRILNMDFDTFGNVFDENDKEKEIYDNYVAMYNNLSNEQKESYYIVCSKLREYIKGHKRKLFRADQMPRVALWLYHLMFGGEYDKCELVRMYKENDNYHFCVWLMLQTFTCTQHKYILTKNGMNVFGYDKDGDPILYLPYQIRNRDSLNGYSSKCIVGEHLIYFFLDND